MRYARTHSWLAATAVLAATVSWAAAVRDVRAPEPAELRGALVGIGSSGSATWISGENMGTTGFRLPATPTTCPTGAVNGSPCHSASVPAGTQLYGRVVRVGNPPLCRCSS